MFFFDVARLLVIPRAYRFEQRCFYTLDTFVIRLSRDRLFHLRVTRDRSQPSVGILATRLDTLADLPATSAFLPIGYLAGS